MSEWRALKFRDDEGNVCFGVQRGSDRSTREVIEFIEPDMIEQAKQYMRQAEEEAARRDS